MINKHVRYNLRSSLRLFIRGMGGPVKTAYNPLTALAACEQGHAADLKLSIDGGANIEMRGRHGGTLLMTASQYGHSACVSLLLDFGASIEGEKYGTTALICAAVEGQFQCMLLLLNRGANVHATDEVTAWSPLHFCSNRCSMGVRGE